MGVLAAVLAAGCSRTAPQDKAAKPVEVIMTTPITDDVTDYQDFTGRLDSLKTVDIRARVSGYVLQAPFKEGDVVREGDLLFQIDPRTYQADYNQAVANLRQAEADRKLQEKNVERSRRAIGTSAISQEEYDQSVGNWEKAVATVGAMEAAKERSKLYLDYTHVIAPMSGRISRRYVDPGNLITADNTLLTTLVAEDPVYAYFDVDERTYLDLVDSTAGKSTSAGANDLFTGQKYAVLMRLANEDEFSHPGVIDFVDNRLNGNTGTIRVRGVFENPKRILKAGLFVRIRLPIGKPYKAILIPDEAILSDQGRKYVYVVNGKQEAEYRSVTPGQAIHGLRVVREGLAEGDRIIVGGMQRVRPNTAVLAKAQDPPKPPSQRTETRGQRTDARGQKPESTKTN
jgi:RND family efflux transporter MFP subunit